MSTPTVCNAPPSNSPDSVQQQLSDALGYMVDSQGYIQVQYGDSNPWDLLENDSDVAVNAYTFNAMLKELRYQKRVIEALLAHLQVEPEPQKRIKIVSTATFATPTSKK